jgi:hypothetical protein
MAYRLALRYVQPVPVKKGVKNNITFATFQQQYCFVTTKATSDKRAKSDHAETHDSDEGKKDTCEARIKQKFKQASDHGSRETTDTKEGDGGASKHEEDDYDSDQSDPPPNPCTTCNQHLIPDQKDDREKWHWRSNCPVAKKVIQDYLERKERRSKKKKTNGNLATLGYKVKPVRLGEMQITL